MVHYCVVPAWDGAAAVVFTARGLAGIYLSASPLGAEHAVLKRFPEAEFDERLHPAFCRQLQRYFQGERADFDVPLDLEGLTPFQMAVLKACARIPFGKTRTYGDLARELRRPQAARAVGGALARNPVPIVIPCHRVVGSGGCLGGFSAEQGIAVKRRLLDMEAKASAL